jgi:hypothetical protein
MSRLLLKSLCAMIMPCLALLMNLAYLSRTAVQKAQNPQKAKAHGHRYGCRSGLTVTPTPACISESEERFSMHGEGIRDSSTHTEDRATTLTFSSFPTLENRNSPRFQSFSPVPTAFEAGRSAGAVGFTERVGWDAVAGVVGQIILFSDSSRSSLAQSGHFVAGPGRSSPFSCRSDVCFRFHCVFRYVLLFSLKISRCFTFFCARSIANVKLQLTQHFSGNTGSTQMLSD